MKTPKIIIAALLLSTLALPVAVVQAQTEPAVVRAVLFYSPTCGHCEYVIQNTLLPLVEQYGDQLQIAGIDVSQPQGQTLFLSAMQEFGLETAGVPLLVIDDKVLIGSVDIPEKFPVLVETYLAQGGADWPDIPGLDVTLTQSEPTVQPSPTSIPVVRAILFYRSACSHCQEVVKKIIPPLQQKYGDQLEIFGIDVSTPDGKVLYDAAVAEFAIETLGVPTLILGDQVLIGTDIQEQFDGIIVGYLNQGGMDWPNIPGLSNAVLKTKTAVALTAVSTQTETLPTTGTPAADSSASPSATASPGIPGINHDGANWRTTFARDLAGNTFSVFVLLGMLGSIVWALLIFKSTNGASMKEGWAWTIPLLSLTGMAISGYLAYVETQQVDAFCGPVGDCNIVQQSEYARLFGVLPIGVLGLIGYAAILLAWLVARFSSGRLSGLAVRFLFGMTILGTLFSVYLTFLEPFVIGATCAWCLTSAVLMTLLMLLMVRPAKSSLSRQRS